MVKNKVIKNLYGTISRNNFNCFRITDSNFCRNISLKTWHKLKGLSFDKFQNTISLNSRFIDLDIWKRPFGHKAANQNNREKFLDEILNITLLKEILGRNINVT